MPIAQALFGPDVWFCQIEGVVYGPAANEELNDWYDQGQIQASTQIWKAGHESWLPYQLTRLKGNTKSTGTNRTGKLVFALFAVLVLAMGIGGLLFYRSSQDQQKELAKIQKETKVLKQKTTMKKRSVSQRNTATDGTATSQKTATSSINTSKERHTYTLNYNINVRKSPSVNAEQVGYLYRGDRVDVTSIKNIDNEIWGQIGTDRWVCIYDGSKQLMQ